VEVTSRTMRVVDHTNVVMVSSSVVGLRLSSELLVETAPPVTFDTAKNDLTTVVTYQSEKKSAGWKMELTNSAGGSLFLDTQFEKFERPDHSDSERAVANMLKAEMSSFSLHFINDGREIFAGFR
jgi:hypothetical protein